MTCNMFIELFYSFQDSNYVQHMLGLINIKVMIMIGLVSYVWLFMCGHLCVVSYVWLFMCGHLCVVSYVWLVMCGHFCVIIYVWLFMCG